MDLRRDAKIAFLSAAWFLLLIRQSFAAANFTVKPQNVTLDKENGFYLNCSLAAPSKNGMDWWYAPTGVEKTEPICESTGQNTTLSCNPPDVYYVERPDDRTTNLVVKNATTGKYCCYSENGDHMLGMVCAYVTALYSTPSPVDTSTKASGEEVTSAPSTDKTAPDKSPLSAGAIAVIVIIIVVIIIVAAILGFFIHRSGKCKRSKQDGVASEQQQQQQQQQLMPTNV